MFQQADELEDSTILVTGCAGFLGYYILNFPAGYKNGLGIKLIVGLDNFMLDQPAWIDRLASSSAGRFERL